MGGGLAKSGNSTGFLTSIETGKSDKMKKAMENLRV